MADNSAEIAELEAILNSGVDTVSVDGLMTKHNLTEVRKRLNELKKTDDATTGKRRMFTTINTRADW